MGKKRVRWDRIFLVALAVLAVVVLVWQLQTNDTRAPVQENNQSQQSLIGDDEVYLTIGSEEYTFGELNAQYQQLDEQTRMFYSLDEFIEAGIVPVKLLLQEAQRLGVTVNDSALDEQVEYISTMAAMQGMTFEEYVRDFGFTEAGAREKIREDLIVQELLERAIGDNITVEESELLELYETWGLEEQNLTFEEVRFDLEEMVKAEKYNEMVGEYLEQLRNSTNITYHFSAQGQAEQQPEIIIGIEEETMPEEIVQGTEESEAKEFRLTGHMFYFQDEDGNENPDIIVNVGDTVRIVFDNVEGVHDWVVDEIEGAFTNLLQPGQSETIEFTATEAGEYEYYCSYMQHRAMGMFGRLIVEE